MSKTLRIFLACLVALAGFTAASQDAAPVPSGPAPEAPDDPAKPKPQITVAPGTEEGKPVLIATVMLNGKPVKDARVTFGVKRTFGTMILGQDDTLDDGTAEVKFPTGLPGDATGQLQLVVEVKPGEQYNRARAEATVGGGRIVPVDPDPFPRALWAPHAPLPIVITICTLLIIVWSTFAFVVSQLLKIRKEPLDVPEIPA
jgi:hypothetical protein